MSALTALHPRADLQHTVYRDFEQLSGVRDEWDGFVGAVGGDLFSTFDWCEVWWHHFGQARRPEIHIFRRNGEVVAILPLFREVIKLGPLSVRAIRVMGCDHTATTCSLAIEPQSLVPVMRQLYTVAIQGGSWDLLHLGPLPGYYESMNTVREAISSEPSVQVEVKNEYPHMLFHLPDDYDAYLGQLSLKERRNVRRDERRLERAATVTRECVNDQAEVRPAFTRFVQMHQEYWTQRNQLGHFKDWPGVEAFHSDMVQRQFQRGRLVLMQVKVDEELVASEYCYRFGHRLHWMLAARKPDIPGKIGFCSLVRHCVSTGVQQVDAMRGYYEYKRLLGARVAHQTSIIALRRDLTSRVRCGAFRSGAKLLDLAYYKLWFSRLAPRVSYLRRPLWHTWIRSRI